MELTGDLLLAAPRERVWHALNDPTILSQCIPGCEEIMRLSDTETRARVLIKMGPVRARFVGKILMADIVPEQACKLVFEGSGGAAGFARGNSNVTLSDEGGATRLTYTATASVGGKLGQIGGRMIDASARQMAERFFSNLQASLAAAAPETPAPGAAPAAMPAAMPATMPATASGFPVTVSRPPDTTPRFAAGEGVRVLWFVLGAASTGFGVWLATHFAR
jgi:carbon monoxide dehydrogenase subunit G